MKNTDPSTEFLDRTGMETYLSLKMMSWSGKIQKEMKWQMKPQEREEIDDGMTAWKESERKKER